MKPTIQIALVLDNYKLPNKEAHWAESFKKAPEIAANYKFVSEEVKPGPTEGTTTLIRKYTLK